MLNHTQMQTYAMMRKLGKNPVSIVNSENMYGLGVMLTDYRFHTLMQYLHKDRGQEWDIIGDSDHYWNIKLCFERCLIKALSKQHIHVKTHDRKSKLNRLRIANHNVSYYLEKGDDEGFHSRDADSPLFLDLNAYYRDHKGHIPHIEEIVTDMLQNMLDYAQLEYDYVSYTDELIHSLIRELKLLYRDCVEHLNWWDDYVYDATPQKRKQMREVYDPQVVIQECVNLLKDYE